MKVGLYFGSFNPIHIGHLIIANTIANYTDLNQIWLIVSPQNPLKPSSGLLNEYHRLHLVRLAVEQHNKLKASDIEFHLPKPSFTIDTLTFLKERYPNYEFTVIVGSDSFQNIHKWKNAPVLIRDYNFIIYQRPGFIFSKQTDKKITVLKAPLLEISATDIRNMVKEGKSIRYLVPENVEAEILANNYYK